jgi:hypothetical protein
VRPPAAAAVLTALALLVPAAPAFVAAGAQFRSGVQPGARPFAAIT